MLWKMKVIFFLTVKINTTEQFFIYIMGRTSYFFYDMMMKSCTRPTCLVRFSVLAHWNNIPQVDMSLYSDTLSWFWTNHSWQSVLMMERNGVPEENKFGKKERVDRDDKKKSKGYTYICVRYYFQDIHGKYSLSPYIHTHNLVKNNKLIESKKNHKFSIRIITSNQNGSIKKSKIVKANNHGKSQ